VIASLTAGYEIAADIAEVVVCAVKLIALA
jgi:hypothetical protein